MEKVILVGVNTTRKHEEFDDSMEECLRLCEACDYEVLETMVQKTSYIDKQTCVGSGKLMEISERREDLGADTIIFLNRLSASQIAQIQEVCECDVLDRTGLILQIFAKRAKTKEAQLQVEVATLQYDLPHLVNQDASSDQQRGGSAAKNKGKGETNLELNRRIIMRRITDVRKELELLEAQAQIQRQQRLKSNLPMVALVGYTNAGKSSFMNQILTRNESQEDKFVFEKDMLFATLDTSVRNVKFDDKKEFLLFDTVGFVSNLPTELVEAFKSTLSAAKEASILLHIIDSSSIHLDSYVTATEQTLKKIGAGSIPVIKVYNKADLCETKDRTDGIYISAKTGEGFDELLRALKERLYPSECMLECIIPYSELAIIQNLKQIANIEFLEDCELGKKIKITCSQEIAQQVEKYKIGEVNE